MVKAGDRKWRSDFRQINDSISFRCWAHDKVRFKRIALRLGFPSLSAWIMDLMKSEDRGSLQLRRLLSGQLGQIGGRMALLATSDLPEDAKEEASVLAEQIARIQDDLMMELVDASETD